MKRCLGQTLAKEERHLKVYPPQRSSVRFATFRHKETGCAFPGTFTREEISMPTFSRRLLAGALLSSLFAVFSGMVFAMPLGNAVKVPLKITADCARAQDFRSTGYGVCRLRAVVPLEAEEALARVPGLTNEQRKGVNLDVVWEVQSAENRGAVAAGFEAAASGLAWHAPVAGRSSPVEGLWTKTDGNGTVETQLTDILGERTVTVCASVMTNRVRGSACAKLAFGKGPLSRFTKPSETPIDYSTHEARCRELGAELPSVAILQTVSLKGRYNALSNAFGAGIAAGWPFDLHYWGEPSSAMPGRVRQLQIRNGSPHGAGAIPKSSLRHSVCLKP